VITPLVCYVVSAIIVANVPGDSETVWTTIPRELYREDCEVMLDVGRVAGDYAALAGLTLYQRLPYRGSKEGGNMAVSAQPPGPTERFDVLGPSLSRGSIRLSSVLREAEQACLRIYDLCGALVNELPLPPRPGAHVVVWNGTDARGRRLPSGAYFCRLERSRSSQVRKVVLTR
jgi:hypothetical protein